MALGLFAKAQKAVDATTATRRGGFVPSEPQRVSKDSLERALQYGRYGTILAGREEWLEHPRLVKVLEDAAVHVDRYFAYVPDGFVSLPQSTFDEPGAPEESVETEPFLLGRCAVTNADYQSFVDDGGYENLEWWPEDIWPELINFRDGTGQPGPRFWRNGRHDRRLANYPAVGVCYHEAHAFAAWAGYRLPSDAEWQMAASWRIRSAAHQPQRYPWGDGLETERCNIWSSGYGGLLPVDACPKGAAPNGVLQLIGNVWEWTDSDFNATDRDGRVILGDALMKCVRGGAYDTYFPWQASSEFRTGMSCLARVRNVGFRCATSLPEDE